MDSNLTRDSVLLSTLHDRERRDQRGIDKVTLQEARRYGMKEKQGKKGVVKYFYAGHVFVYNERTNRAITSYKYDRDKDLRNFKNGASDGTNGKKQTQKQKPKPKPIKSGTRFVKPLSVDKSKDHVDIDTIAAHEATARHVRLVPSLWTSHTVIIVDMSGSMREDDVNGARCRSDGVWTTLARNFCRSQLEDQTNSLYDVVSVIAMRATAQVVIECEPLTWVLYNKLVDLREWENMMPRGHGFYKPALAKASDLLAVNSNGSCALSLMFFSDGKPSDFFAENDTFSHRGWAKVEQDLVHSMGELASKFGRRLNITCIGMAEAEEKFTALDRMAKEAGEFGAVASFHKPSLNTDSLSQIISSSVASSLSSKTELTSLKTGTNRSVRTDVQRERANAQDGSLVTSDWRVFSNKNPNKAVDSVWTWSSRHDDFVQIIDPRCRSCMKPVANCNYKIRSGQGVKCPNCQACFYCTRCVAVGAFRNHTYDECGALLSERRHGFLVGNDCPQSLNVAWKKKAFGEGAERLAFKFRFTDPHGKLFLPGAMVAKESRFLEDMDDYLTSKKKEYHMSFMRTQSFASQFATMFNDRLQKDVPEFFAHHVPTIKFVKSYIFEMSDLIEDKTYNVLVEPLIEGTYRKFSGNHGDIGLEVKRDFASENQGIDLVSAARLLGRDYNAVSQPLPKNKAEANNENLGIIEEGDEDEEESDEEEESSMNAFATLGLIPVTDYLHAFSHASYAWSRGKMIVVDLQGSLGKPDPNTLRRTFLLTDPAIHERPRGHRRRRFGRTDLGRKGIKAFFQSHQCNDVCRLLRLRDHSKGE